MQALPQYQPFSWDCSPGYLIQIEAPNRLAEASKEVQNYYPEQFISWENQAYCLEHTLINSTLI